MNILIDTSDRMVPKDWLHACCRSWITSEPGACREGHTHHPVNYSRILVESCICKLICYCFHAVGASRV